MVEYQSIGLESTVISLYGKPRILRPGAVDMKDISKVLKINVGF